MIQLTIDLLNDTEPTGETMTSLSQEDFPANHTAQLESDLAKKMTDISGRKCVASFEKFNRHGSWAKMFSALLIGQEDWYSKRCRLTWKLKGTRYNRMYFQLQVSAHHTEEIGFGLLPTPRAQEIDNSKERIANGKIDCITTMAKMGMLPTPTAFDWNSARTPEKWEQDKEKWAEKGVNLQMPLKQMARFQMLPTPTAMDSTGATANMKSTQVKEGSMHSVTLSRAIAMGMLPTPKTQDSRHALKDRNKSNLGEEMSQWGQDNGIGSQLNPLFVAEMMNFPPDWTVLPFLNGDKNPSKPTETP